MRGVGLSFFNPDLAACECIALYYTLLVRVHAKGHVLVDIGKPCDGNTAVAFTLDGDYQVQTERGAAVCVCSPICSFGTVVDDGQAKRHSVVLVSSIGKTLSLPRESCECHDRSSWARMLQHLERTTAEQHQWRLRRLHEREELQAELKERNRCIHTRGKI